MSSAFRIPGDKPSRLFKPCHDLVALSKLSVEEIAGLGHILILIGEGDGIDCSLDDARENVSDVVIKSLSGKGLISAYHQDSEYISLY